MPCGIYIVTGPKGRQYVGHAVDISRRWKAHRSALRRKAKYYHRRFVNDWHYYGEESFSFSTLEVCEEPQLVGRENFWLGLMKPFYNLDHEVSGVAGGRRGEESKRRMSEAAKLRFEDLEERALMSTRRAGKKSDPEDVARRAADLKGKPRSVAARKAISEGQKKRTPEVIQAAADRIIALNVARTGRKTGEAERAKKSVITAGLWEDPEYRDKQHRPDTRAKMSAAKLGTSASEDTKAKMSIAQKERWARRRLESKTKGEVKVTCENQVL